MCRDNGIEMPILLDRSLLIAHTIHMSQQLRVLRIITLRETLDSWELNDE